MDWATLLFCGVFVVAGLATSVWSYHVGFKAGEETERNATAARFHQFRIRRFNAGYDELN